MYHAQAIIKMIAVGAKTDGSKDKGIYATLPRLKTVTRKRSTRSLTTTPPLWPLWERETIPIYEAGQVFAECSGRGMGLPSWPSTRLQRDSNSHSTLLLSPAGLRIDLLVAEAMTKAVPSTRWANSSVC